MLIRPTYAKVNLAAIKHNIASFRQNIGDNPLFCAVVKADAYGHGAVMTANAALDGGGDWLDAAMPEEARELREAGIKKPVLVLGPSSPWQWEVAAELDLNMVVVSQDCLKSALAAAKKSGKAQKLHIKVDTGMNRVGVRTADELSALLDIIESEPYLELEGLMTHFSCADETDKWYTNMQAERFDEFVSLLRKRGLSPIVHAANSATAIDSPELSYDMVRVGISLYGCYPSADVSRNVELKPALSFYSHISQIKNVEEGDRLSYGGTFTADKQLRVATLPLGYADGFSRLLSNKGEVLIHGRRARVLGRVCMDQILVDITEIEMANLHDEAVIIGRQGKEEITAAEVAERIGTIDYEVLCGISKRVPRLYYEG